MTSLRKLVLVASLALGGALAPAAAAERGGPDPTICVHAPAGTVCDFTEPDLATALAFAGTTFGPETILLGNPGTPEVGPFVYPTTPTEAGNDVAIKAVGAARPVLTAPPGKTVLTLVGGSVEGIDVRIPSATSGAGIEIGSSALRDVRVTGPGAGPTAGGAEGIRALFDLTLDDVKVAGTGSLGLALTNGKVDATNVRVSDVARGASVGDNAHVTLRESRIAGRESGIETRGTTAAASTIIETSGPKAVGVRGGDGTVTLDHVTVAHRGPLDGTDSALDFHPVDFGGEADLSAVVLAGYTRGIRRDTSENFSPFPITIRDSVWDPSHDVFVAVPDQSPFVEAGNAHADPALVDVAGGDLRLHGSSPAVDRDAQTDPSYVDVDGAATVGDAADAGALEYRRTAPSIDNTTVPPAGGAGQVLTFSADASDADADALTIAWDFGDGTVATGAQAAHAFAPGIHTVTLNVTDEAGLSTSRTFSVAIAGDGPTSGGGPAKDVVAPKLSKVRLSKNHRTLLFTISERAKVRVTVHGHTIVKTVAAGRRSIRLGRLRHGVVKITATDLAGNRSAARRVRS
jgi:PKD domain